MKRRTNAGTSMLYITGFLAVFFLLVFGLLERQVRAHLLVGRSKAQAQAHWIVEAGAAFAAAHPDTLQTSGTVTRRCGAGEFSISLETPGVVRVAARVPPGGTSVLVEKTIPLTRP